MTAVPVQRHETIESLDFDPAIPCEVKPHAHGPAHTDGIAADWWIVYCCGQGAACDSCMQRALSHPVLQCLKCDVVGPPSVFYKRIEPIR